MEKFTYVSLFSGVGGFEQALNRLGGTCVFASEIDRFASRAYETLYGGDHLYGDVTKIDAQDVPNHDLLVGGFPCQSFSVAGKRGGFDDARGTLFFEIARIASVKQPSALLLENVKGLVNHDKGNTLDTMIRTLNEIGYVVDFEIVNSKFFGVPQNRERIFIVAVRKDLIVSESFSEESTKGQTIAPKGKRRIGEWADVFNFGWPEHGEVTTRLRDILETNVDEKYYLSEDKTAKLVAQLEGREKDESPTLIDPKQAKREGRPRMYQDVAPTLTSRDYKEPNMIGHVDLKGHDAIKRVYSPDGINPTLTTMSGGHREPKIAEEQLSLDAGMKDGATKVRGDEVASTIPASYYKGLCGQSRPFVDEIRPVLTPERMEKRQNGRRFKEDGEEMFTLTSQDRHGIAIREATTKGYAVAAEGDAVNFQFPDSKTRRGRVGKEIANTLEASSINQGTPVKYYEEELSDKEKERNTFEILRKLWEEVGEETIAEWRLRILDSFQSSEVLQSRVYGEGVHGEKVNRESKLVYGTQVGERVSSDKGMREMWFGDEFRRTPQGRELEEQYCRELASIMSIVSHTDAPEKIMLDLRETAQGVRVLQQALHSLQETWMPPLHQNPKYRIRKLTPLETFRLQGFPDEAHQALVDAGISDSQRYKMAGNAVTVNVIEALGERLLPLIEGER